MNYYMEGGYVKALSRALTFYCLAPRMIDGVSEWGDAAH